MRPLLVDFDSSLLLVLEADLLLLEDDEDLLLLPKAENIPPTLDPCDVLLLLPPLFKTSDDVVRLNPPVLLVVFVAVGVTKFLFFFVEPATTHSSST